MLYLTNSFFFPHERMSSILFLFNSVTDIIRSWILLRWRMIRVICESYQDLSNFERSHAVLRAKDMRRIKESWYPWRQKELRSVGFRDFSLFSKYFYMSTVSSGQSFVAAVLSSSDHTVFQILKVAHLLFNPRRFSSPLWLVCLDVSRTAQCSSMVIAQLK